MFHAKSFLFLILISGVALGAACRSPHEWSVIFTRKGQEYAKKGEFDPALAEYRKAIAIDPKNYEPYFYAADLFLGKKDCQVALSLLNHAATLHSDIPLESYVKIEECTRMSAR